VAGVTRKARNRQILFAFRPVLANVAQQNFGSLVRE
jgi:hypothetical protein